MRRLLLVVLALGCAVPLARSEPDGKSQPRWELWQSAGAGPEVVDQVQEHFDPGSHANVDARRRVGQIFVPERTPLRRFDVQLNNRNFPEPGWVRIYRWRGDYASTVAGRPLWSDGVDLSGTRGFREHVFHPELEVEPGLPLYIEFGAGERPAYAVRHSYKRTPDPYPRGRMLQDGKTPRPHWDLWFRSYGAGTARATAPAREAPSAARRAAPPFPASTERRRWFEPGRSRASDRDEYLKRLERRAEHLRSGVLASCVPAPWEALSWAALYRVSCEHGRCDESRARTAHELIGNIRAWRDCSLGHPSRPSRCAENCGEASRANQDWLLAATLVARWTSDAKLGDAQREQTKRFIAKTARDAWDKRRVDLRSAAMSFGAAYANAAAVLPDDPLAKQWRTFALRIWDRFFEIEDTAEDSASYQANVFIPSLQLMAQAFGREEELWSSPVFQRFVERAYDRTAPLGVEPDFGHGAGWFHQPAARIWLFEEAATRLRRSDYKWMARQTFDYLKRHARDRPPQEDLLGRTSFYLGLAWSAADPSLAAAPPLAEREFESASTGSAGDRGVVAGGERVGVRLVPVGSGSDTLAGLELEWDGRGDREPLRVSVWPWRGSESASRAGPPVYARNVVPAEAAGLERVRLDPLVATGPTSEGLWVEMSRARAGFDLTTVRPGVPWLRSFGLRSTGSRLTVRRPGRRLERKPGLNDEPFEYEDRWTPDKLVLRGGPDPNDTFAMFNLVRGYHHGQDELAALTGLIDGGSVLLQNTPFPYWFHDGGRAEDESLPFLRRHSGGRQGEGSRHARITRFLDGRHATIAWIEFDTPTGWGVRQERRVTFVKNRFLLVRDGYHFPVEMRASAGPVWHVADLRSERAENWVDIYDRVPLSNVFKIRNPERYALLHFPRRDATLEWARPSQYLPAAGCATGDFEDTVRAECRAGPSRIVAQRWTGTAAAGSSRWFETLIVPHGAKVEPAELAAGIEILESSEDFAAFLRLGGERWLVADLAASKRLALPGRGTIEGEIAVAAFGPALSDPYVFGDRVRRVAIDEAGLDRSWVAPSGVEMGSPAEARPLP